VQYVEPDRCLYHQLPANPDEDVRTNFYCITRDALRAEPELEYPVKESNLRNRAS